MDMSPVHRHSDVAFYLVVAALWVFPIGVIVLRRHLVAATGARLGAKVVLLTLAWITGPFAVLITAPLFFSGAIETVETLRMLARAAW